MSDPDDQRLLDAVQAGDEDAARRALADGADSDATLGRPRSSVLNEAVYAGRLELLRLLVEAGAGIGTVDRLKCRRCVSRSSRHMWTWCDTC
jgi:hypothetical protein